MNTLPEPRAPEEFRNNMLNIFAGVEHKAFSHAVLADVVDTIPIIGDISNVIRTKLEPNREAKARQLFDTITGILPGIGDISDIITPTNTLNFCLLPPLTPPIRKFRNR
jgi:hypothetical protein